MKLKCPTFAEIQLVRAEDGWSLMAYCYPTSDNDDGVVVVNLDDLPPDAFRLPDHLERG